MAEYKYYQMSDEAEIVKKNISRRLDALWWYKKKRGLMKLVDDVAKKNSLYHALFEQ